MFAQRMTNQQLWQWVHHLYGTQLGLTASDDDYQSPDSDYPPTPDVSVSGPSVLYRRCTERGRCLLHVALHCVLSMHYTINYIIFVLHKVLYHQYSLSHYELQFIM